MIRCFSVRMDAVILSYGDTLIRQTDLDIIKSDQWLNDQIIGFFFEFCQNEKYSGSGCIFPGPEVTQCIKLIEAEQLSVILDPLALSSHTAVFLPVNNNQDPDSPGGSHWSLLVLDNRNKIFYHLDSLSGANYSEAKALAGKISQYEGITLNIREVPVTQQKNGFDCGVHCLANADRVANHIKDHQSLADIKSLKDPICNKRTEILELIDKLKNFNS